MHCPPLASPDYGSFCVTSCYGIGRGCPSQLEMWRKVAVSTHFSLVGRVFCWYWLFFIWTPLVNLNLSSCDPCIRITRSGQGIAWTPLSHTHYSCQGKVQRTCVHSKTTDSVCHWGSQCTCFDPQYSPNEDWLEVRSDQEEGALISRTRITNPKRPVSVLFDVRAVIGLGPEASLIRRKTGTCHGGSKNS